MKFSTAIFAVTLLASSALASPAAEPEPRRSGRKNLDRAGVLSAWCITPGSPCYKNKRDLDTAVEYIAAGYQAPHPDHVSKREAFPRRSGRKNLDRAGVLSAWCITPGSPCYKSKRDFDEALDLLNNGFEAPHPDDIEKREASPRKALTRAGKLSAWCTTPGLPCYKSKRDFDEALDLLNNGFEAPHPDDIEKREASPKKALTRAGKLSAWCTTPGSPCYKSKREYTDAVNQIIAGDEDVTPGDVNIEV